MRTFTCVPSALLKSPSKVSSLTLGPAVYHGAGLFGLVLEIGLPGLGPVGAPQGVEVGREELVVLLGPEGISLLEFRLPGGGGQVPVKGGQRGPQVRGLGLEGEDGGDLGGGFALGALVGHGEGRVHAVRREEQVAGFGRLLGVELEGDGVGARGVGGLLGLGFGGRVSGAGDKAGGGGQQNSVPGFH